jgi:hypothetical protein
MMAEPLFPDDSGEAFFLPMLTDSSANVGRSVQELRNSIHHLLSLLLAAD